MSILSVLPFRSARAVHSSCSESFVEPQQAAARRHDDECLEMIGVTVASRLALLARKALLACPGTAVERCVPLLGNEKVKLEVRFPAGQGKAVIGRILAGVPEGEVSGIFPCAKPRVQARHAGGATMRHRTIRPPLI